MKQEEEMVAVYDENGNKLDGVMEVTTPVIKECYKDTTVLSRPYYYKIDNSIKEDAEMKERLKAVMQKQSDNLKELFKLIDEHPDLPIVPMVDADIVADDSGYWLGGWGSAGIDKYLPHEYGMIFYEQGRPDVVDIFEKFFDYEECGISEEMPDSEALPIMRKKIDSLDWIEAIIINIGLPDTALCDGEV